MSFSKWSLTLLVSVFASFLLILSGCSGATVATTAPAASAAGHTTPVPQDPALRITTEEVMKLFAMEYGDAPLIEETLKKNKSFVMVDARPLPRFQEGTIPGSIHMPPAAVAANLDKLPKDKLIIFWCGGLACPLSPEAAEIAKKNGVTNIKVYYEGDQGWKAAGNYMISDTPYVKRMVDARDKENVLVVDSRPALVYNKEFIPGSVSIPWAQFEQKKGLLPNDKNTNLIFLCGGHHCDLSHFSASAALKMGYKNVKVYSAGFPDWKKSKFPTWGNESSGIVAAPTSGPSAVISPEDFTKAVASGKYTVIDVRGAREIANGMIPGAINIPDGDFMGDFQSAIKKIPADKPVLIHCATGARAAGVFFVMEDEKYKHPKGVQYLDKNIAIAKDGSFTIK
ncbi:rhodanese-like domain-containing protein [Chrysiogenes arsenatis]|uniref:rhodanese-like domain-containing protein n=1 Tax=Chrysiogenes arsenatis TaxID=309797 RepID=UPI0003FC1484|nr:rhodanese-like domain-containing protein [Chrysiogenes arsenatis]